MRSRVQRRSGMSGLRECGLTVVGRSRMRGGLALRLADALDKLGGTGAV
jgi:hypothetical protein